MTGFFRSDISGGGGSYSGAAAIVNGKIAGLGNGGGQLRGTYEEKDGKFVGSIKVSVPGGGTLASGAQVGAGQSVDVPFNVPASALDGHQFSLTIGGRPISVRLKKLADL